MTLLRWFRRLFQDPPARVGVPFTPRAASVLNQSRQNAENNHRTVPTVNDVALALLELDSCCAANILERPGIDAAMIDESAASQSAPDSFHVLLPSAQKEMCLLQHRYLGTEHLLLALRHHARNSLGQILARRNITLEHIRQLVLQELDPNFIPSEEPEKIDPRPPSL